jgi:hypothetical protein
VRLDRKQPVAPAVSGEPFYQPGMSRSGPGFLLDLLFDRMIHML